MEPPPLEEFKRLMESLGPDSMFADDYADSLAADEYIQPDPIPYVHQYSHEHEIYVHVHSQCGNLHAM